MSRLKSLRIRTIVSAGLALAALIAGAILPNGLLVLIGVFGLMTTLRFTQLDRWRDNEQTEMYLPTYKKEWEDKKDDRDR